MNHVPIESKVGLTVALDACQLRGKEANVAGEVPQEEELQGNLGNDQQGVEREEDPGTGPESCVRLWPADKAGVVFVDPPLE